MNDTGASRKKLHQERVLLSLVLIAFSLAAVASGLYYFRLDLTQDHSYTLSPASARLSSEIPETVTITYYVSGTLAERHPGPRLVQDFLRELEARNHGRIRVTVRDPSEDPGRVESLGIYPQQMQVSQDNENRIATVYSGIVVEYLDDYRVLPAILGTDNLEYEIVKAVRSLVRGSVPVAALLLGDADKTPEKDYRILSAALARAGYEVRTVPRGAPIEPDVSVLFILGNAVIDTYDAYSVDRYLAEGGRVFAAARGIYVDPDRGLAARPLPSNALIDLFTSYGVDIREELVLDALCLTVPFQTQSAKGGEVYKYVRYPHWVVTDKRNVASEHPITSRYTGLDLYWPSPLEIEKVEGLTYTPLVKSTNKAWKQTKDFAAGPGDEMLYHGEEEVTRGQYILAVAVSGIFPPAFQGRKPPARAGVAEELPAPATAGQRRAGRLVVVGSSDFLTDLMSMSQSEFNASFAVNSADWLTADGDMTLPSQAPAVRRLAVIEDPKIRSMRITYTYLVNLILVPVAVAGYALARALRRRRAEQAARGANKGAEA